MIDQIINFQIQNIQNNKNKYKFSNSLILNILDELSYGGDFSMTQLLNQNIEFLIY